MILSDSLERKNKQATPVDEWNVDLIVSWGTHDRNPLNMQVIPTSKLFLPINPESLQN